ncbi:hypothetical protein ACKU4K_033975, partial [Pseudomonas aeruginosa]
QQPSTPSTHPSALENGFVAQSEPYDRQTLFDLYMACLASKLAFGFSSTTLNTNIQRAQNHPMATLPFAT